jgi:TolB protein
MSPSWSPDGGRLAYVSFEGGRSRIMMQELATGLRREVTAFPGINGAPAFSPDGRRLALTLSRDGSPDIYVLDLASGELQRLTTSPDIDTEPAWSPDGRSLVFTSDRSGGRPQLFQVSAAGGDKPRRLTFSGRYNARAAFSPDGSRLVFVHESKRASGNRIAVMVVGSGEIEVLTNGILDESPTFAPNGRMILYAATEGDRAALAAVSIDGRFRQRLSIDQAGVRDPAWSPRLSRR